MEYGNQRKGLTREQKTGFVLLLIFGLLAVGLGILQMRNAIFGPFAVQLSKAEIEESNLFADENARLQSIDTDHDGLNDYEELNFYETSPYLPDTDSDGINDKTEIERGSNPLCPEGETCGSAELMPVKSSTSTDINLSISGNASVGADFLSSLFPNQQGATIENEVKSMIENPSKIREMLSANGEFTKEQLDKIDDATLVKLLTDVLSEQGAGQMAKQAGSTTTTLESE